MKKIIQKFVILMFSFIFVFGAWGEGFEDEMRDAESGSFSYTYPIAVPQGTYGMAPSLAIRYNSQAGDGMLGMGFSLSGLSSITRDLSYPVNKDSGDHFLLDGQKLIKSGGIFQYHTENENFAKITFNGSYNSWTVVYTNGVEYTYGSTGDSRIEAAGIEEIGVVREWALSKVKDVHGNYYTIEYMEDTLNGDYYPKKIIYTQGNNYTAFRTVTFEYQTRTGNDIYSITDYSTVKMDQLLSRINVLIGTDSAGNNGSVLRKYDFSYEISPSIRTSRLTSITKYGSDGASSQFSTNEWDFLDQQGHQEIYTETHLQGFYKLDGTPEAHFERYMNVFPGDMNGDGRGDLVVVDTVNSEWRILFSHDNGFEPVQTESHLSDLYDLGSCSDSDYKKNMNIYPMDVDGNGKTDLVLVDAYSSIARILFAKADGSGFEAAVESVNLVDSFAFASLSDLDFEKHFNLFPMDVNSDGKDDFVWLDAYNGIWRVILSNGSDFNAPVDQTNLAGIYNLGAIDESEFSRYMNVYVCDILGGAEKELLVHDAVNGVWRIVYSNAASGSSNSALYLSTRVEGNLAGVYALGNESDDNYARYMNVRQLDLSGDGKDDFVLVDTVNGYWKIVISNGDGLYPPVLADTITGLYKLDTVGLTELKRYMNIYPADVNGDGKDDLVLLDAKNGEWRFLVSHGSGFEGVHQDPALDDFYDLSTVSDSDLKYYLNIFPLDINNDSRGDIVVLDAQNGVWRIIRSMEGATNDAAGIIAADTAAFGVDGGTPQVTTFDWTTEDKMGMQAPYTESYLTGFYNLASVPAGDLDRYLNMYPGDFDGDGFDDFIAVDTMNGKWKIVTSDNPANVFNSEVNDPNLDGFYNLSGVSDSEYKKYMNVYPAYLNDDNKNDLVVIDAVNDKLYTILAKTEGTGFEKPVVETRAAGYFGFAAMSDSDYERHMNIFPMDVNGDYKTDLVWLDAYNGIWRVFIADREGGYNAPVVQTNLANLYQLGAMSDSDYKKYMNIFNMLVNADNKRDLVLVDGVNGTWRVLFAKNPDGGTSNYFSIHVEANLDGLYAFPGKSDDEFARYMNIYPADISGDGLDDLVLIDTVNGIWRTITSKGNGFHGEVVQDNLNGLYNLSSVSTLELKRYLNVYPADVDGDKKLDIVLLDNQNGEWRILHSNGSGFEGDYSDPALEGYYDLSAYSDEELNRYMNVFGADMNGDSCTDIITLDAKQGVWRSIRSVDNSTYSKDMVSMIMKPSGAKVAVEYNYSTKMTGAVIPLSDTGDVISNNFPRYLVRSITYFDGMGGSSEYKYDYYNGKFYKGEVHEHADLGFEWIRRTNPDGSYIQTYYSQEKPKNGRVVKKEVYGTDSKLYSRQEFEYEFDEIVAANTDYHAVGFVKLVEQRSYNYNGTTEPVVFKQKFDNYNDYGLPEWVWDYGEVSLVPGDTSKDYDDRLKINEYAVNSTTNMVLPIRGRTFAYSIDDYGFDGNAGTGMTSDTKYYYDNYDTNHGIIGSKGLLTSIVRSSGVNQLVSPSQSEHFEYDEYGNIIKTTDSMGNISTIIYDPVYHTWPVSSKNALEHQVSTVYDGYMRPVELIDSNGVSWKSEFDVFGRSLKSINPGDRPTYPTSRVVTSDMAAPADFPKWVRSEVKNSAPGADVDYLTSIAYFDGLGRVIQEKVESENTGQWVTTDYYYDNRGRLFKSSAPYDSFSHVYDYLSERDSASRVFASTEYDPVGRVKRSVNFDGTSRYFIYDKNRNIVLDEAGHVTETVVDCNKQYVYQYDADFTYQGLLANSNLGTHYSKTLTKAGGNGSRITQSGSSGDYSITQTFDMLGRKLSYSDPDMGTWYYEYDANGNMLKQTDGKGQTLTFEYDQLNRVLSETYSDSNSVSYGYDAGGASTYSNGKLTSITGSGFSEGFNYNVKGQVILHNKQVGSYGSKSFIYDYDSMGRLVKEIYPDGEAVFYTYNNGGNSESLFGNREYVSSIDYAVHGKVTSMTYGNGVSTSYSYFDSGSAPTYRLKEIEVSNGGMHYQYGYDLVGNLSSKDDLTAANKDESYIYDRFYRLTYASGSYGSLNYSYDEYNNITSKGGRTYRYDQTGSAGPHAVTNDGIYDYSYDGNGNMVSRSGGRTYTYDAANRLTGVAEGGNSTVFSYGASTQRLTKTDANKTTVYFFPKYAEEWGGGNLTNRIKYYEINGQKVANDSTVKGLIFYHSDHLGSASTMTDSAGNVIQKMGYKPYGSLAYSTDGSDNAVDPSTTGITNYTFTGQESDWDTGLMYYNARYYDPELGRFITGDPGKMDGTWLRLSEHTNPYMYCGNNPVNYVDPTGKALVLDDIIVIGVAILILKTAEIASNYADDMPLPDIGSIPGIKPLPLLDSDALEKLKNRVRDSDDSNTEQNNQPDDEPEPDEEQSPTSNGPRETVTTTEEKKKPNLIYISGSAMPSNLTPRPGKDDTPGGGLSAVTDPSNYRIKPGSKYQVIDMNKVKSLIAVPDPKDPSHLLVRPATDSQLKAWAATRSPGNPIPGHPYTAELMGAIVGTGKKEKK